MESRRRAKPDSAVVQLLPQVALSNSFGFGGHNSCVLFRKFEG